MSAYNTFLLSTFLGFCMLCPSYVFAQDDGLVSIKEQTEESRKDKSMRLIDETLLQYDDLKEIFMYPYEHSEDTWYYLAGLGGLILVDKPVTAYYQDKIEPIFAGHKLKFPSWAKFWPDRAAEGYITLGVTSSYLVGMALNDARLQQSALLAGKASVYSILISHLTIKTLLARKRPVANLSSGEGESRDYTTNPFAFGYYHAPSLQSGKQYGTAMPSLHYTDFFAVAKVYQKMYGNYWVPYSLLAIALTSNIQGHKHWVSDMVAGAVIGTLIGDVITDHVLQDDNKSSTMILPTISGDEVGLSLNYQF